MSIFPTFADGSIGSFGDTFAQAYRDTITDPILRAQHDSITLIDLPMLSDDEIALIREYAHDPHGSDGYARSYPSFTLDAVMECPECDGTGVFLICALAPDDLIEQTCVLCCGTGVIDIADAPTQELEAVSP